VSGGLPAVGQAGLRGGQPAVHLVVGFLDADRDAGKLASVSAFGDADPFTGGFVLDEPDPAGGALGQARSGSGYDAAA
jgi:hypothetical protein